MLSGVLLSTLMGGLQIYFPSFLSGFERIVILLGIALAAYGFYPGFSALKDQD